MEAECWSQKRWVLVNDPTRLGHFFHQAGKNDITGPTDITHNIQSHSLFTSRLILRMTQIHRRRRNLFYCKEFHFVPEFSVEGNEHVSPGDVRALKLSRLFMSSTMIIPLRFLHLVTLLDDVTGLLTVPTFLRRRSWWWGATIFCKPWGKLHWLRIILRRPRKCRLLILMI